VSKDLSTEIVEWVLVAAKPPPKTFLKIKDANAKHEIALVPLFGPQIEAPISQQIPP